MPHHALLQQRESRRARSPGGDEDAQQQFAMVPGVGQSPEKNGNGSGGDAVMVFRFADTDRALEALAAEGIRTVGADKLFP